MGLIKLCEEEYSLYKSSTWKVMKADAKFHESTKDFYRCRGIIEDENAVNQHDSVFP